MIKNLLYSLFFHLLLFSAIYFSFNFEFKSRQPKEVVVTLASYVPPAPPVVEEKVEEVKKEEPKKEEKPKEEPKKPESKKEEKKPEPKKKEELKKEKKKEEKKPDPKKEEKKPEPKKEEKKPEVKKEEKPKEKLPEKKPEAVKEETKKTEEKPLAKAIEKINTIESLDLSMREKFNIQSQLKRCYKRAIAGSKRGNVKVMVKVSIDKEGYITSNLDELRKAENYQNESYKIAFVNVKTAIDFCNPLSNLPSDKYDIWKEILLEFDDNLEN